MVKKIGRLLAKLADIIVIGIILSTLCPTLDIWSAMQMFWGEKEKMDIEFGPVSIHYQ